jgi:hypothetical protein
MMKLAKGDRVRTKKLPPSMSHFHQGTGELSYRSRYAPYEWAIRFDDGQESCWYPQNLLEVIAQAIA